MNDNILLKISQIVARCLNEEKLADIPQELEPIFPQEASPAERGAAIDKAVLYSLVAEQPGYPDDGRPGYLPADADLKASVLNEIDAMIKADFDKDEHRQIWESIRKTVAATSDSDFALGLAVNCPDDYLLTLDRLNCGDILREKNLITSSI